MRNIIIIGGSGFLGSAVTAELLANGYHVFAVQNQRPVLPQPGLTIVEGGMKSLTTARLDRIRPEAVFHCARPTFPRFRRWGRLVAALQARQYNDFLISQIMASHDRPSLIFASGSLVYGNSDLPHTESAPVKPISYARQYHHGESPVLKAVSENNVKAVMLRFPWLLGNGSWFSWFYLKPLREKRLVPLFGDGTNLMSLISVADAARMMVRCFNSDPGNGVYNIYSPHTLTQKSFAGLVAGHYGGSVTAYSELFPGNVEKAVIEAFTSNILLSSNHPELLKGYPFQSLEQVMDEILL